MFTLTQMADPSKCIYVSFIEKSQRLLLYNIMCIIVDVNMFHQCLFQIDGGEIDNSWGGPELDNNDDVETGNYVIVDLNNQGYQPDEGQQLSEA